MAGRSNLESGSKFYQRFQAMNNLNVASIAARSSYVSRFFRELKFALAALEIGSRTVGLADHRELVRDLAARAASLYPTE